MWITKVFLAWLIGMAILLIVFKMGRLYEIAHTEPQRVLPQTLEQIEAQCERKVAAAWFDAQAALDQAHPGWRLRGCYYQSEQDIDP